jgi:hypothetical protein
MKRYEARTNIRLGSLMFVVALLMFATAFVWAVVYLGFAGR